MRALDFGHKIKWGDLFLTAFALAETEAPFFIAALRKALGEEMKHGDKYSVRLSRMNDGVLLVWYDRELNPPLWIDPDTDEEEEYSYERMYYNIELIENAIGVAAKSLGYERTQHLSHSADVQPVG